MEGEIGIKSFVWLCITTAWESSWEKADTGATIAGITIPIIVHFVPAWEHALNSIFWEIPVACLASIVVTRLVLSPFLVYRKRDTEAREAERKLEKRHTEEELCSHIGELYASAAELRIETIRSEVELEAWITRFNSWREETLDALHEFGLPAEYALFQNADASGARPLSFLPPKSSILPHWMDQVKQYDAILSRHQAALGGILEHRRSKPTS
jgi:hypothetical protein